MDIVDGFNQYFEIKFKNKKLTTHIPVKNMDEIGVRTVMTQTKLEAVFETLCNIPKQLPQHFKARRKKIEDLLQSGYPMKIAEAARELSWREKEARLSKTDAQFLSQAKDMLVKEIALVTNSTATDVQQRIDQAIAKAINKKQAVQSGA